MITEADIARAVALVPTKGMRYNGKCRRCKTARSVLGVKLIVGSAVFVITATGEKYRRYGYQISVPCPKCSADPALVGVAGYDDNGPVQHTIVCTRINGIVRPEIACSVKCTGATGHDCQCSCGGKNHGAGHG